MSDVTIIFSPAEVVSLHNDLAHLVHHTIGPRQTGAAKIVDEAQRLLAGVEIPKNERCEEVESGGVQCDLVKGHKDGHWIKMSKHTRYWDDKSDTHPEEYIR